jgi:hypothetical protein
MKYNNMFVISSTWGETGNEKPTFRMFPLTEECPYQECIYDPTRRILAVISKIRKQNYIMTHKVDDNGDPVFLKPGAKRGNGKNYKEERRLVETFTEYYIESPAEVTEFVAMFAINTDVATRIIEASLQVSTGNVPMNVVGDVPVEVNAGKTQDVKE